MKKRGKTVLGILAACLLLSGCGQTGSTPDAEVPEPETAAVISTVSDVKESEDTDGEAPSEDEEPPVWTWTDWWMVPVFAHAMGTVDGRTETNSLDAFLQSYDAGQRVFEVDLQLTSDGRLVARHDWEQISYFNLEQKFAGVMDWETFLSTPIIFYYTPVDIDGLVLLMEEYQDVYLVTDSKDTDEASVRAQIKEIVRAVGEAGDPTLWERIIVQIYHEDMYRWVSEEAPAVNWIYTLYQIDSPDYERIGAFCQEHDIPIVTISTNSLNGETVEVLHRYGRRIYVHTVNKLRAMLEMSWGADGFYSDYVTPREMETVMDGTSQMYLGDIQSLFQD